MNHGVLSTLARAAMMAGAILGLSGCGGGGGDGDPTIVVNGTARSVLNDSVQASRSFQVIDPTLPQGSDPVASGQTNSNGNFTFNVKVATIVIVIFPKVDATGEPRTAGLVSTVNGDVNGRVLKDETDVACEAGAIALGGGLSPALLTVQRIANLEAAARILIDADEVDFTSSASVTAAANEVLQMTNNGANPPAQP